jgi:peptidoglycan/xylan/chitin deacetylase (PgdA/CDA1 family)
MAGGALPRTRAWLRARPRLQGLVLAPFGCTHRLPHTAGGVYFLLYHGVAEGYADGLRGQLEAFLNQGPFVSWEQGLSDLAADDLPGPRFCLSFDDAHKEWAGVVLPLLAELNVPASFFITTERVAAGQSPARLTWDDCAHLVVAGMNIGSHSVTHSRLALLEPDEARREIFDSKQELEARLGVCVQDFSVPFGLPGVDYAERDVDLMREAGYRSCASALPGRMTPGDSPLAVRRCGLSPAWPMLAVRTRVHE